MTEHDHSYKLLFSHRRMMEDLLRGFIHEDWVERLDFSTLEKVSGSYVSDDLRGREDDVIWRVRWGGSWLYVYVLLEFQSTIDRFMAVRIMTYLGLLYQDLIAGGQLDPSGHLPPVLPVVLYNGDARWTAATELADLIAPLTPDLDRHRPRMHYLLLDEGRLRSSELRPLRNLAAALFRLENSRTPADVIEVVAALIDWLKDPGQEGLRRSFTVWLQRVLLPRRMPGVSLPHVTDLLEVKTMLSERVKEWTRQWREEGMEAGRREGLEQGREQGLEQGREQGLEQGREQGLEQGREQGRKEGRREGEALVLAELLEHKFGPLSAEHRQRLEAADSATLLAWSRRVLTAGCIEDVLKD